MERFRWKISWWLYEPVIIRMIHKYGFYLHQCKMDGERMAEYGHIHVL